MSTTRQHPPGGLGREPDGTGTASAVPADRQWRTLSLRERQRHRAAWPATSPGRRSTTGAGCPRRARTGGRPPRTSCWSCPSSSRTPACTRTAPRSSGSACYVQDAPGRGRRPRCGPARAAHPAPRGAARRARHVHRAAALSGLGRDAYAGPAGQDGLGGARGTRVARLLSSPRGRARRTTARVPHRSRSRAALRRVRAGPCQRTSPMSALTLPRYMKIATPATTASAAWRATTPVPLSSTPAMEAGP